MFGVNAGISEIIFLMFPGIFYRLSFLLQVGMFLANGKVF